VEFATGTPSRWFVRLKTGATIELWADSYSEESDHFLFDTYVHASDEEQQCVDVTARSPIGGPKVLIVAARIPKSEVEDVWGGPVTMRDGKLVNL
jgi:hypothetical protein